MWLKCIRVSTLLLCLFVVSICAHSHDAHAQSSDNKLNNISNVQLWSDTVLCVLLISSAPLIFLYFIPNLTERVGLLKILLGFAAGGLLGDAFLHLIPHAMIGLNAEGTHSHSHDQGHSHGLNDPQIFVGFWVLMGIVVFLSIEKFVRCIKNDDGHGHSHQVSESKSKSKKNERNKSSQQMQISGASFLVSRNVGLITTLTVLVHELPHEVGDYAILIQSGCSSSKAMMLQLLTALGALLGASLSLYSAGIGFTDDVSSINNRVKNESIENATKVILPMTAGGFIYIALVTVLPELLKKSKGTRVVLQSLGEILALLVGVGMMVVVGLYE